MLSKSLIVLTPPKIGHSASLVFILKQFGVYLGALYLFLCFILKLERHLDTCKKFNFIVDFFLSVYYISKYN